MNQVNYERCLRKIVSEGTVEEITRLVKRVRNTPVYFDTITYINRNLRSIAERTNLPEVKTFGELVRANNNVNSPLRKLPIVDEYITVLACQSIPYTFNEFARLISKTELKGMKVIFGVHDKDCEVEISATRSFNYFLIQKLDKGVRVTTYLSETKEINPSPYVAEEVFVFSDLKDETREKLFPFFCKREERTLPLSTDNCCVYAGAHFRSVKEHCKKTLESGKSEFIIFSGFTPSGQYRLSIDEFLYTKGKIEGNSCTVSVYTLSPKKRELIAITIEKI